MMVPAHVGLGWGLAHVTQGNRCFRTAVVLASVIPDIDSISFLFGIDTYIKYHHVLAHNFLFFLVVSFLAVYFCKEMKLKTFLCTQLACYSHYFGDYFFTRYPLQYFYPFSNTRFLYPHGVWLGHILNFVFLGAAAVLVIIIGIWYKRTPVEIISPELDNRIVNVFFQKKMLSCHICNGMGNEYCNICGRPVCFKHASLGSGFVVICRLCRKTK